MVELALDTFYDRFVYFGLPSFLINELIWLILNVPYLIIEKYHLFEEYKLQSDYHASFKEQYDMFKQMIKEHILFTLPTAVVLCIPDNFFTAIIIVDYSLDNFSCLIDIATYFGEFIILRVCSDMIFYFLHRLLHGNSWLFNNIHKIHHEHRAPFALTNEHAHWFEAIFVFLGNMIYSILICGFLLFRINIYLLYFFIFYANLKSIEEHCGYFLPIHMEYYSMFNWINGGSQWHDLHHSKYFNCNFGEKWIDNLFGTDIDTYLAEKQKKQKKKQK